ncbi:MAG: hypothetical protein AB1Y36_06815, partial [Cycloclasticus sp.]
MSLVFMDERYQLLDQLPESLYSTVITLAHGELLGRVDGILQWRLALLAGELPRPERLSWPETRIKTTLLKKLDALNIAMYCKQQPALTDQVLLDICEGVATAQEYFKLKPDSFVDKLAQQQNKRERATDFKDDDELAASNTEDQQDQQ